jgi:hypothetical protein
MRLDGDATSLYLEPFTKGQQLEKTGWHAAGGDHQPFVR